MGANRQPAGGSTKDLGFASAYVFGAVCPVEGKAAALIMPICNSAAMNHHLIEISSQVAADAHAVVILDRAGWHRSQGLVVPGNITLLELPPYSPELNPVERIWHYLRSHWLANSVFSSLADVMDACEMAWNRFATDDGLIRCSARSPGLQLHPLYRWQLLCGRDRTYTRVQKFPEIRIIPQAPNRNQGCRCGEASQHVQRRLPPVEPIHPLGIDENVRIDRRSHGS